jgi:hypothetical protein
MAIITPCPTLDRLFVFAFFIRKVEVESEDEPDDGQHLPLLLDFSRHICSHFDGSTAGVTDAELTKAVNDIIAVETLIYNGFPYVLRLKTKTKTKSETETETKTKTKTKTRELNTNALKKLLPSYLCVTLHIHGRSPIFMG